MNFSHNTTAGKSLHQDVGITHHEIVLTAGIDIKDFWPQHGFSLKDNIHSQIETLSEPFSLPHNSYQDVSHRTCLLWQFIQVKCLLSLRKQRCRRYHPYLATVDAIPQPHWPSQIIHPFLAYCPLSWRSSSESNFQPQIRYFSWFPYGADHYSSRSTWILFFYLQI